MIFIDIVDYIEPTMLIVGSRGLGNLKGYIRLFYGELYALTYVQYFARFDIPLPYSEVLRSRHGKGYPLYDPLDAA